jgi:hypothetical protein
MVPPGVPGTSASAVHMLTHLQIAPAASARQCDVFPADRTTFQSTPLLADVIACLFWLVSLGQVISMM